MNALEELELVHDGVISFCDERLAAGIGVPDGTLMSLTLATLHNTRSWGEFLDREEALALYGWLGLLLSQPPIEAPDAQPSSPGPTHTEQESE